MKPAVQQTILMFVLLGLSLAGYVWLGYFTPRENFGQLIGIYGGLFAIYAFILAAWKPSSGVLFGASIIFRLALIMMIPNLSDDYFRFLWDGRLWVNGDNPFLHLPGHYMQAGNELPGLSQELYDGLNSKEYFTIYPPVCQGFFAFAAWLFPNDITASVITLRVLVLLGDIGAIYFLQKLLYHFSLPKQSALIYALNPLVIMEVTGNLHFEGVMVCFLLWAVYLAATNKPARSALAFALAVSTKLVPLMFLPFFYQRFGLGRSLQYYGMVFGFLVLMAIPFIDLEIAQHFWNSLDLYFQKFEFNASVYYIARWIGELRTGWNLIAYIGPGLSVLTLLFVAGYALFERNARWHNMPQRMLIAQSVFYFLATTVHPWYLVTLVALAAFTNLRYALVWSFVALLSYYTYITDAYQENLWLVAVEYSVVAAFLFFEMREAWLQTRRKKGAVRVV